MVDVQRGTIGLPIIIQPRINGTLVTQTEIKEDFSNFFVDNITTPLTWTLEFWKRGQETALTVDFDASKSTDDTIFFDVPNSFWADYNVWMVLAYWKVTNEAVTTTLEQIYSDEAIQMEIKDLQLGL